MQKLPKRLEAQGVHLIDSETRIVLGWLMGEPKKELPVLLEELVLRYNQVEAEKE